MNWQWLGERKALLLANNDNYKFEIFLLCCKADANQYQKQNIAAQHTHSAELRTMNKSVILED